MHIYIAHLIDLENVSEAVDELHANDGRRHGAIVEGGSVRCRAYRLMRGRVSVE